MTHTKPLPLRSVKLMAGMPQKMQQLVREQVLPYQWETLNDRTDNAVKSHCIMNFRIAAGLAEGTHEGVVFLDSDLYKWLEAVSYSLEGAPDAALEALADGACALIAKAQCPDGYLNTYYTLKEPGNRYTSLQQGHELYCAGHLFEAAVAYHSATGKTQLLDIACRFANHLTRVFGTGAQQIPGYPGHQVVELGLVKLYRATGTRAYLDLASYFIRQRGQEPHYFLLERSRPGYKDVFDLPVMHEAAYGQWHLPPAQQTEATGHAVRALYMYSAMADLALLRGDTALATACDALYESLTQRRMYITGGVGSSAHGESFTGDYDLPNDTMYGESCASVALMMFAARMAALRGNGAYYDTVERAFFNHVLGGIAQTGTEFFYADALSVHPAACRCNPGLAHIRTVRQRWFDVACCPTNIARTIMSIASYAFHEQNHTLHINIPLDCQIDTGHIALRLTTQYPYGDTLLVRALADAQAVAVRDSGLAPILTAQVNGQPVPLARSRGYVTLPTLQRGDTAEITYDLRPRYVYAHPRVAANVGKAAVLRGPVVYCAEQADNGTDIAALRLPAQPVFTEAPCFAGNGAVSLTARGDRAVFASDQLYQHQPPRWEAADITLIPYHLWANRGEGEMQVYLHHLSCTDVHKI